MPDVVFANAFLGPWVTHAVITAVHGENGLPIFTVSDPLFVRSVPAAGDIDGDGVVEIIAIHENGQQLVALENTGAVKWLSDALPAPSFNLADSIGIADLDQDGWPEIFVGASVFDRFGSLLWQGTAGVGSGEAGLMLRSNAVDLVPSSPGLELLAGHTAYRPGGGIVWNNTSRDGGSGPRGATGRRKTQKCGPLQVLLPRSGRFSRSGGTSESCRHGRGLQIT